MKYEHKAIISKANAEGRHAMEFAPELLTFDLVESMKKIISGHAVAYRNMSEQQQDACLAQMQTDVKEAVDIAIGVIHAAGSKTVRMKLTKATIGTSWQFVGSVASTEEFLHELGNKAQDKSDVLVLIAERDYFQGLDAIRGEKDQKSFDLDDEPSAPAGKKPPKAKDPKPKAAKKDIELPEKLIADAKEYILRNNVATIAALQNGLHIGFEKGEALMARLEADGNVSAPGEDGTRTVIKSAVDNILEGGEAASTDEAQQAIDHADDLKNGAVSFDSIDTLTDELYERIKAKVIADQTVSAGAISVSFDCEFEVAEEAVERLEVEGVISEEDEMGQREILQAA